MSNVIQFTGAAGRTVDTAGSFDIPPAVSQMMWRNGRVRNTDVHKVITAICASDMFPEGAETVLDDKDISGFEHIFELLTLAECYAGNFFGHMGGVMPAAVYEVLTASIYADLFDNVAAALSDDARALRDKIATVEETPELLRDPNTDYAAKFCVLLYSLDKAETMLSQIRRGSFTDTMDRYNRNIVSIKANSRGTTDLHIALVRTLQGIDFIMNHSANDFFAGLHYTHDKDADSLTAAQIAADFGIAADGPVYDALALSWDYFLEKHDQDAFTAFQDFARHSLRPALLFAEMEDGIDHVQSYLFARPVFAAGDEWQSRYYKSLGDSPVILESHMRAGRPAADPDMNNVLDNIRVVLALNEMMHEVCTLFGQKLEPMVLAQDMIDLADKIKSWNGLSCKNDGLNESFAQLLAESCALYEARRGEHPDLNLPPLTPPPSGDGEAPNP